MRNLFAPARFADSAFQSSIVRFAFLGLIATAVLLAPFKLAAQQAAPATTGETAAAPPAASSDSGQSQEDQDKAFRLEGPIVVATAKALHLSLETTARMFELINFAVIVLAIVISGIVSITLTPMLCSRFLKDQHKHNPGAFLKWSERSFQQPLVLAQTNLPWTTAAAQSHSGRALGGGEVGTGRREVGRGFGRCQQGRRRLF